MIVRMLEAVEEMLKEETNDRVVCARTMLSKIIDGMREGEEVKIPSMPIKVDRPKRALSDKKEVQIAVDNGVVTNVLNATEDTRIELDGKIYTPAEAIGKTFKDGRIL